MTLAAPDIDVASELDFDADVPCCNPKHEEPVPASVLMRVICPSCARNGRASWPCCETCAAGLESLTSAVACPCGFTGPHGAFWTRVSKL